MQVTYIRGILVASSCIAAMTGAACGTLLGLPTWERQGERQEGEGEGERGEGGEG